MSTGNQASWLSVTSYRTIVCHCLLGKQAGPVAAVRFTPLCRCPCPGAGGRSFSAERAHARHRWCPSGPAQGTAEPSARHVGDTPAGEERPVWKSEEQPCEHPCGGRSGGRRRSGTGAGAVSVQADDSTSNGNEGVNGNGSSDADARLDILFYLVHRSLLSGISDSEKLWDSASEGHGTQEYFQSCGVRHSARPSSGYCRAALSGR